MARVNRQLDDVVAVRLRKDVRSALQRLAYVDDRNVGGYIRRILEAHVAEREPMRAGANREH